MRYSGLILNDVTAAPGICLTFFTQGCPHHCPGCHNPETWDYEGGKEFTNETLQQILNGLYANGIKRKFCLMGGEPLCDNNLFLSCLLINEITTKYPDVEIYVWTGYLYEDLKEKAKHDPKIQKVLESATALIDGPYIEEERDITLPLRGSRNQRIIFLDNQKKI